ncbi:Transcription termination factor mterf6, chloroplastic/mitochondrial [Salvia divinorum]|uniref:Transcription termination factor mterf6, chloroplastic/mitochondrial n=1 Tax=Salvia divinorum TaxID=28513 RepID=A0ABD1IKJ3_SALDI
METGSGIMWFFKDRGFDDKSIHDMSKKCKQLNDVDRVRASETWDYLKSIGIPERKLPTVIGKCPKILTLDLHDKLVPMIQCLATLGTKPKEVASAITKFPHILVHSLEEKLCPLLAFFEGLGAPEKQLGKMILLNPRIISYSIESKLSQMVDFLAGLGLSKEGMIESQLQRAAINFPEIICRDVDKTLRPNVMYLESRGFSPSQIAAVVGGYPPVLIKSASNSLGPRIKFLEQVMGRQINEVAEYPEFFRHGLKGKLESRQKLVTRKGIECSLSEMLECNHKKFLLKFGM